jgi:hypothetical protein
MPGNCLSDTGISENRYLETHSYRPGGIFIPLKLVFGPCG